MKLWWGSRPITKNNLRYLSIKELYRLKQELAPVAYRNRDDETAMKAVVLINNEISRKLIKARGATVKWKIPKHSDLIMTDPWGFGKTISAEFEEDLQQEGEWING